MLVENEWINDRAPTKNDGDICELILLKGDYIRNVETRELNNVTKAITVNEYLTKKLQLPWKHTKQWCDTHKKQPRQITQITGYSQGVIALADDGTVWFAEKLDHSYQFTKWRQLANLPNDIVAY